MSLPTGYTQLLELSRQMQLAARAQDWESLSRCEAERGRLIATLPPRPSYRSTSEAAAIAACLREIQDCDRQVLDYVLPWRQQVGELLGKLEASVTTEPASQALAPDTAAP